MKHKINAGIRYTIFTSEREEDSWRRDKLWSYLDYLSMGDDSFKDLQLFSSKNHIDMFITHQINGYTFSGLVKLANEMSEFLSDSLIKEIIISIGKLTWHSPMQRLGDANRLLNDFEKSLYKVFSDQNLIVLNEIPTNTRNLHFQKQLIKEQRRVWYIPIEERINPCFRLEQLKLFVQEIYQQNEAVFRSSNIESKGKELWLEVILPDMSTMSIHSFQMWLLRKYGTLIDTSKCHLVELGDKTKIAGFRPFQLDDELGKKVLTVESVREKHIKDFQLIRSGFFKISLPEAVYYLSCLVKYQEYNTDAFLVDLFKGFEIDGKFEKANKLYQILKQDQTLWLEDDLFENFMSALS